MRKTAFACVTGISLVAVSLSSLAGEAGLYNLESIRGFATQHHCQVYTGADPAQDGLTATYAAALIEVWGEAARKGVPLELVDREILAACKMGAST